MEDRTLQGLSRDGIERWPSWRLRTHVLVFLHGPSCGWCAVVARQVAERTSRWGTWGVDVVLVREEAAAFERGLREAQVPEGEGLRRWAPGDGVLVAVLDRRGSVAGSWALRHPHELNWHEVDETVRWVGVQEPECGTCAPEPAWTEQP